MRIAKLKKPGTSPGVFLQRVTKSTVYLGFSLTAYQNFSLTQPAS